MIEFVVKVVVVFVIIVELGLVFVILYEGFFIGIIFVGFY